MALGTRLRVTNLQNGRRVIVTVIGPLNTSENWDIDISMEAARNIELEHYGVTPVRIEVLSRRKSLRLWDGRELIQPENSGNSSS
jgi:rare lipoprotein A